MSIGILLLGEDALGYRQRLLPIVGAYVSSSRHEPFQGQPQITHPLV